MDDSRTLKMTKTVEITRTGKIKGIKGLYRSTSGRFYVRYSYHGIDRQVTISPENKTFSGLELAAKRALCSLKKEVQFEALGDCKKSVKKASEVEVGISSLKQTISNHWSIKGASERYIDEIICTTRGLAVCQKNVKYIINEINDHNERIANDIIYNPENSQYRSARCYSIIKCCFDSLMNAGIHYGNNPIRNIPRPKYIVGHREDTLTVEKIKRIIAAIRCCDYLDDVRRAEYELFFTMLIETGQRPKDLYMFNMSMISNDHCLFFSHKTSRNHRIKHLISVRVKGLIVDTISSRKGKAEYLKKWKNKHGHDEDFVCIWSRSLKSMSNEINKIIHSVCNDETTIYSARHFFISEIFRMTESEFWASVFTHEGRCANERHYLHASQERADEILTQYFDRLNCV